MVKTVFIRRNPRGPIKNAGKTLSKTSQQNKKLEENTLRAKQLAIPQKGATLPYYNGKVDPRKPKYCNEDDGCKIKNTDNNSNYLRYYWRDLLKIAEWIHFGKNYKMYLEYEKSIMNSKGSGDDSSSTSHSDVDLIRMLQVKLGVNDKRPANFYKYLYFDHIFPISKRKPTQDIDLQALDLALSSITDIDIPIDLDKLISFFESEVVFNKTKGKTTIVNSSIVEVKNRVSEDNWKIIKNLYIEFKMKGVIGVKEFSDVILAMASKDCTISERAQWHQTITPKTRFSALKLGTLFLSIFHNCYVAACQESNFVIEAHDVYPNNRVQNPIKEITSNTPEKNNDNNFKYKQINYNQIKKTINEKSGPTTGSSVITSSKLSSYRAPRRKIIPRKVNRIRYDKRIPKNLIEEFKNHMFI